MNAVQFTQYIRKKTKTNSTTFTDADILMYANIAKDDIAKEIAKVNEDYFGIELLRNLVAGKRNYKFPSDVLNQIKYVQAKLDNVSWLHLDEFDVNSYKKTTDESSILAQFAGKKPQFDIFGSELSIYSDSAIIDVVGGLKLWAIIYPADLTSLSGTNDLSVAPSDISFGVPRQFHLIWAIKVIIEYKTSKDRPMALTERELNVANDMQLALNSLKGQNLDRSVTATMPDYYNNGQDL